MSLKETYNLSWNTITWRNRIAVIIVALVVSLLSLVPFWRAQSQAPPGWTFTGNLGPSPDYMQYRVWARQTQETGLLVDNKFTTEPNEPHLPVVLYYVIGKVSSWLTISPELVYAYAGAVFSFSFIILLFVIVRHFLDSNYQSWWVFLIILIGGGLGAHLRFLSRFDFIKDNLLFRRVLLEGFWLSPVFESFRGNYVIQSLFDTHFMVAWLATAAAIFSFYLTLKYFSIGRLALTAFLFFFVTLLHLYEGVTLLAITAFVLLLLWRKKLVIRTSYITVAVAILSVTICLVWQILLYRSSGLPLPTWRGLTIPASTVLIAYPLAWLLIAWGVIGYWKRAGLKETFLLGWIVGCTVIVLSAPFYPYPNRGTMTLQIALYIVAGAIYFHRYTRVTWLAGLIAFLLLIATPILIVQDQWEFSAFNPQAPYMFLSDEHQEFIDLLKQQASENDILIVDKSEEPWTTDDLWLAPEYPGRLYCGHFFLTPDYDTKCQEVADFYQRSDLEKQVTFLSDNSIRFIYVDSDANLQRFERIPGLIKIKTAPFGSLFAYQG